VDPVEYLQQAEGDTRPGVTARSRYYQNGGQFTWAPCYVLGYLEEEDLFEIQWQRSGVIKTVKRLNLLFDQEDHEAFRTRLQVETPRT
jgi:hypothetical protein